MAIGSVKRNPKNLNAEDVGAIPTPIHLGTDADFNEIITAGLYFGGSSATNYTNTPFASQRALSLLVEKNGAWGDGCKQTCSDYTGNVYVRYKNINAEKTWSDWTTGFLPLTGGTLSGNVGIAKTGSNEFSLQNKGVTRGTTPTTDQYASISVYDSEKTTIGLIQHRFGADGSIRFAMNTYGNSVEKNLAQLGVVVYKDDTKKPYYGDGNTAYELLHTGNKPTGTYTGNGDATTRTILIDGIGDAVLIKGNNGTAIVGVFGAIIWSGTTVTAIPASQASYSVATRLLTLATTNAVLNTSGQACYYQLI